MKKPFAALFVLLALGVGLFAVGTVGTVNSASAATAGAGGGQVCRKPAYLDGLTVTTCAYWDDQRSASGKVTTTGSNNTTIDLCVELVDANQNLVPNSRTCQIQHGSNGLVQTPWIADLAPGTYYAVSYFTNPTYWYGGETPGFLIF